MRAISRDGTAIAYERIGDGPPALAPVLAVFFSSGEGGSVAGVDSLGA